MEEDSQFINILTFVLELVVTMLNDSDNEDILKVEELDILQLSSQFVVLSWIMGSKSIIASLVIMVVLN